jgi:hypothetical protein
MDTSSAGPLFLGVLEPSPYGVLEEPPLVLAALGDDGLLAGVEDRSLGGGEGEIRHLPEEVGISPKEVFVVGVDLQGDDLP